MNNQPLTSHHLKLISQFAPYLIEVQPQRPNPAIGSILATIVTIPPDFNEVEGLDGLIWHPSFTPPRFSTSYLERVHTLLLERDIKVQRLEHNLTTIAESFLTKQDQEVQRNPSRPSVRRLIVSGIPYAGHFYPIIGPHHVVPVVNLVGCWINDSAIRALYKSTFHTIRKLTRGSRSLVKGNAYE